VNLIGRPVPSRLFCGVALAALAACGESPPERPVAFDFLGALRLASVDREVTEIALGTPAGRAHLAEGWSIDEVTPEGRPFVWSEGEESSVDFFLTRPRELRLRLQCAPLTGPGTAGVTVTVNGRRIAGFGWSRVRRYRPLPAESLVAGTNPDVPLRPFRTRGVP
jgi:hypothetical protein